MNEMKREERKLGIEAKIVKKVAKREVRDE